MIPAWMLTDDTVRAEAERRADVLLSDLDLAAADREQAHANVVQIVTYYAASCRKGES